MSQSPAVLKLVLGTFPTSADTRRSFFLANQLLCIPQPVYSWCIVQYLILSPAHPVSIQFPAFCPRASSDFAGAAPRDEDLAASDKRSRMAPVPSSFARGTDHPARLSSRTATG
jgi:hypothetical protein